MELLTVSFFVVVKSFEISKPVFFSGFKYDSGNDPMRIPVDSHPHPPEHSPTSLYLTPAGVFGVEITNGGGCSYRSDNRSRDYSILSAQRAQDQDVTTSTDDITVCVFDCRTLVSESSGRH